MPFPRGFNGFRRALALLLMYVVMVAGAQAQLPQAEKIHQQVARIGALGTVTIDMRDGRQLYGTLARIDAQEFSLNEVDQRQELTIRYGDVKKVRSGYGNTRNIRGQRIHPRTKLIVSLAVIGGLLTLVFVAVASDRS